MFTAVDLRSKKAVPCLALLAFLAFLTFLAFLLPVRLAEAAASGPTIRGLEMEEPAPQEEMPGEKSTPSVPLVLPDGVDLPAPPSRNRAEVALQSIVVHNIELLGNTVLDHAVVEEIIAGYEGRELTFEDLQSCRYRLTQAYVSRGFVNSGVVVPDQEVVDGVVRMDAVEGTLNHVRLSGNQYLRTSYIENRLRADSGEAFNIHDLENSLRLMQQWPLIAQVNGQVLPGSARGESILDLRVTEKKPRRLTIGADNHRAPSVGEYQGTAGLSNQSVTGNGDFFNASYALAEGLDDIYIGYGLPLTARDLTIEGYWSQGESDIVEAPFDELDIVSETKTWGIKLHQPVIRTLVHTLVLGLTFENKRTESFLLDQAFSFSPGEQVGKSEISALRLSGDWTWRRDKDAIALRGTLSQGVDWLGATDNSNFTLSDGTPVDDIPDSDFTALLLQAQYARRLPWWHQQLIARLSGQVTSNPLLPVERLAVGGARTVRGYRENQLVRDRGVIASVELRQPLFMDDAGVSRIGLSFAPFVDYGWAKDKSIGLPGLDDPDSDDLLGVGAGLIWNWWPPLYAEFYYGADLKDAPGGGSDESSLQEDGFHFQVTLSWDF